MKRPLEGLPLAERAKLDPTFGDNGILTLQATGYARIFASTS